MLSKNFIKIFIAELLLVVAVGLYFFIDMKDVYSWWVGDTSFTKADPLCDLHQGQCEATLKDGSSVVFSIEPKSIPLMQPLLFQVKTASSLDKIELKMFATNMNMGLHTVELRKTKDGIFEDKGMLPTCTVGGMIWQANVILNYPTQSLGAIFVFQTD